MHNGSTPYERLKWPIGINESKEFLPGHDENILYPRTIRNNDVSLLYMLLKLDDVGLYSKLIKDGRPNCEQIDHVKFVFKTQNDVEIITNVSWEEGIMSRLNFFSQDPSIWK